jgi:hypothetical protein
VIRRLLREPLASTVLVVAGLVVGGYLAMAVAWHYTSYTLFVPWQVPALVSGALGGLCLVVIGAVLLSIQYGRYLAASETAEIELLLDETAELVAAMKERRS